MALLRSPVSVVIPVKDDDRYLRRCLRALAEQTRRPREVIVVDNGSTDASRRVARRFGARILRERTPGIPAAASRGYDAARGAVIARLDADSVPPPDWVARVERAFREPGLDALTGPGDFPALSPRRRRLADLLYMEAYFVLVGALLGRPPVFGSNLALRRAVWRRMRSHVHRDRRLHDDLDLSIHLAGRSTVLDRNLRVAISSRPFRSKRAMLRRIAMGVWTLARHAPDVVRLGRARGGAR
jgi:glycosyltransferase involved in cell wall biosynthesis